MEKTPYDLLIIGGACAGLSAATYAARRAMRVLIITKDTGGQIATTPTVENYPGIDLIGGPELAQAMQAQAIRWGAEMVYDEATKLTKHGDMDFEVTGMKNSYRGKSLLLAYGKTPRNLEVPGEFEYSGRGVSYCVTCDAPLYRNRTVAVVGGGNSAMEGALILAKIAKKVYLVHRRDAFRGEAVLLEQLNAAANIELVLESAASEIRGNDEYVTEFEVAHVTTGEKRVLELDGIFVEIGFIVNSGLMKDLVELDRMNQVITNVKQETSNPGVFAAGDLTDTPYKQAVISASEGAKAALTAYSYLNGAPIGVDWTNH